MQICGELRYAIVRKRDEWRAKMVQVCATWADEGSQQCSSWADEGYNECASKYLNECHWYSPWNCIAGWLCDAYYWVSNVVCQGWYWLADLVCRVFAWVVYWILTIVAYIVWIVLYIPCQVIGHPTGPAGLVKHIFVLVLENRSFDHMLGVSTGQLNGQGGWTLGRGSDLKGRPMVVDGPTALNSNSHGGVAYTVRAGAPFVMPIDPPHEFCDVKLQLASTTIIGAPNDDKCEYSGIYPSPITMSGFVDNYANQAAAETDATAQAAARADLGAVMACLTPDQVPAISTLAKSFAICDRWFCALPGPTWPNRFFLQAATSGGLDQSPSTAQVIESQLDGYEFENGTLYDALDGKELEWRVYHGDAFPVVGALAGMDLATMTTNFHGLDDLASDLKGDDFDAAYTFIEPNYGHVLTHGGNFQCGNSQHPIDDVTRGDALIKYVYECVRQSKYWDSSLIVILYDEHGGFYDHVAPPAAIPPGDITDPSNNGHGFKFDWQGVRTPAVIVSPLIPAMQANGSDIQNCNVIDHTQYDHGSLLSTVENLFGLSPLTKRDAAAVPFTSLLSLSSPRSDAPYSLPEIAVSGFTCSDAPVPAGSAPSSAAMQAISTAETSTRSIPPSLRGFVELAAIADARLHPDEKERIRIRVAATRTVADAHRYINEVAPQMDLAKAAIKTTGTTRSATRIQRMRERVLRTQR